MFHDGEMQGAKKKGGGRGASCQLVLLLVFSKWHEQ